LRPDHLTTKPRVCAVSYLNTVPLVWGMLHSPDPELREAFDLSFALPSDCAAQLASGEADIGIIPVIEMARQNLDYFRGAGIACHGPVRSILLISKVSISRIKTLAVDAASRTSVMLARVILAEKYGVEPQLIPRPADLAAMLGEADAALIIGDPALHLDPETLLGNARKTERGASQFPARLPVRAAPFALPFEALDLGGEWTSMTGLPMVFAVWSGRKEMIQERYANVFLESCRYGVRHAADIARIEGPSRGIGEELALRYITQHIVYELEERDYQGLELYLKMAMAVGVSA
jgi:predicted solute-binding protein